MRGWQPQFSAADVEVIEQDTAFQGYFRVSRLTLRHRQFAGGWSASFQREVFQRGDAVAVLPWDPVKDELILIEQFRPGALRDAETPWMLELVAGIVEPDERDLDVVHREAEEEAGCRFDAVEYICKFYPSAGACDEQIRLFVGCVAEAGVGEIHGLDSEQEDILVHAIPRSEAIAMMDADRINNGHTLIALQWLARHGDALRERWLSERHGAC
ncbi:MAG: NUDIX domain-containing protein [Halieaceae bacterium]|nr:NUDIX domain-containing protein [Halieaceae bacterium]